MHIVLPIRLTVLTENQRFTALTENQLHSAICGLEPHPSLAILLPRTSYSRVWKKDIVFEAASARLLIDPASVLLLESPN